MNLATTTGDFSCYKKEQAQILRACQKYLSVTDDLGKVKVGLEVTGHYSYNLRRYLFDKVCPPLLLIHYVITGINYRMRAMIIDEVGDVDRFSSYDKTLAYAGLFPIIYQS